MVDHHCIPAANFVDERGLLRIFDAFIDNPVTHFDDNAGCCCLYCNTPGHDRFVGNPEIGTVMFIISLATKIR